MTTFFILFLILIFYIMIYHIYHKKEPPNTGLFDITDYFEESLKSEVSWLR